MTKFVTRAEYDRLYNEKIAEARLRFAPLPLASLELQWVGDQMQEYQVLEDTVERTPDPYSDEPFMIWLQHANPSWQSEFSGTIRTLYEAWRAGREQGDEDHRWDCADI